MRAAFIPALPPSALLAGMIAPSFRLVNRFCGKKLLRTCGRRERPHALCALFSRSPLACGRVPYPPYARCGMGRLCGERRADGASVASAFMRKKRASPHRHAHHPGANLSAPSLRGLESRSSPKCIPNPATCAVDSAALRKQGLLPPLPAREPSVGGREGSGATPAEKIGASRAFSPRASGIPR